MEKQDSQPLYSYASQTFTELAEDIFSGQDAKVVLGKLALILEIDERELVQKLADHHIDYFNQT